MIKVKYVIRQSWKGAKNCKMLQKCYSISVLKMPGPISQNGHFYSNDASSPKISWFQISFKSVQPFGHKQKEIKYFAMAYTLLCKLNYGYHN